MGYVKPTFTVLCAVCVTDSSGEEGEEREEREGRSGVDSSEVSESDTERNGQDPLEQNTLQNGVYTCICIYIVHACIYSTCIYIHAHNYVCANSVVHEWTCNVCMYMPNGNLNDHVYNMCTHTHVVCVCHLCRAEKIRVTILQSGFASCHHHST